MFEEIVMFRFYFSHPSASLALSQLHALNLDAAQITV